jgi:hypothetical protein
VPGPAQYTAGLVGHSLVESWPARMRCKIKTPVLVGSVAILE